MKELAFKVEEINFPPKEFIFQKNNYEDKSLYIIRSGEIGLSLDNKIDNKKIIKKLKSGQIFGEFSFFIGQSREISAFSLDFCNLLKITHEDFLNIVKKYPNEYEKYCQIKDEMTFSNNFSKIFLK